MLREQVGCQVLAGRAEGSGWRGLFSASSTTEIPRAHLICFLATSPAMGAVGNGWVRLCCRGGGEQVGSPVLLWWA
jgi:hypothetical protein